MNQGDLRISQAARLIECHVNTLRNYECRGLIKPLRDHNGHRRYSVDQALKIKELINMRGENGNARMA